MVFQISKSWIFGELDALPISDVFIAKRTQLESSDWFLYDAFKLNRGYDVEFTERGFITESEVDGKMEVKGNFSSSRRHNLKGVAVNCGLVVGIFYFRLSMTV